MSIKKSSITNTVTNEILDYLDEIGCTAWRNNSGAIKIGKRFIKFGLKGSPDIIGYNQKGRFIGVEIKIGTDQLSIEQTNFIANAIESNCNIIVASCLNDVKLLKKEILL